MRGATIATAAFLLVAIGIYFIVSSPKTDAPIESGSPVKENDLKPEEAKSLSSEADNQINESNRSQRSLIEEPSSPSDAPAPDEKFLRVILLGIPADQAPVTTVNLKGRSSGKIWPAELKLSWQCQGLETDFQMSSFFDMVSEHSETIKLDELVVEIDHPNFLVQTLRIPPSNGVEQKDGSLLYEAKAELNPPMFWPGFALNVRDSQSREHLTNVELLAVPTAFMASQLPWTGEPFTSIGDRLDSPIRLLGGRENDGPANMVAGLAIQPAAGGSPEPLQLFQPEAVDRGVFIYARSPGYAWGRLVLDVSTGADRELLLEPAAELDLQVTNVQLEQYDSLGYEPTVRVVRPDPAGGESRVWSQNLDETVQRNGLRITGLEPGTYAASVELGAEFSWKKRPLLARQEFALLGGETREVTLALSNPPDPPQLTTLGGRISFPTFGGEENVGLQFFEVATYRYGDADFELSLAEMERVDGTLPTWAFRVEDIPAGLYQAQLYPFLKSWMIEIPADGRDDVELLIPELSEVLVETVDAQTGLRIPLEQIRYGSAENLADQVNHQWNRAKFESEPGTFRYWAAPGPAYIKTLGMPNGLDYGMQTLTFDLTPGLQSVRFELDPAYSIRFEFRVDGIALPRDDDVWVGLTRGIRAVDHDGYVTANLLPSDRRVEVSEPGIYEISFDGIGVDRFQPTLPHRVEVRPGELAQVIIELQRK